MQINNIEVNEIDIHNNRLSKAKKILSELSLRFDYLGFIERNSTGNTNPYHNLQHCLTVALNCFEGALSNRRYLTIAEIRELFIAGLFHDFSHSGGKLTDDKNIEIAVNGVEQLFNDPQFTSSYYIEFLTSHYKQHITEIIQCTQFPFVKEPTTLCQEIIRDSDLMQYLEPDAITFMNGLAKELNLTITLDSTYDFIRKQEIFTKWGKDKLSTILNEPENVISNVTSNIKQNKIK